MCDADEDRSIPASDSDVQRTTPSLGVHVFSDKIMDTQVYFQVVKLCDSFHLWIGTAPVFGNMAVSMCTKYDNVPTATPILGQGDSVSISIAQRLSKKTGKQVFVSCDLSYNQLVSPLIEKRIAEELQANPDKF